MPTFDSAGVEIHYETFGDDKLPPIVLVHGFASSLDGNWVRPGALAKVELPVLIVVGEDDNLVGSADGLAESIPGSELVTIPGREHLTVVPDQRFKDTVVRFLNERSPV